MPADASLPFTATGWSRQGSCLPLSRHATAEAAAQHARRLARKGSYGAAYGPDARPVARFDSWGRPLPLVP